MGEKTKIQWAHHTYNPWRDCTKVSPGCAFCYAETMSHRSPGVLGEWGPLGLRARASASYQLLPFKWDIAAEKAGERRRVFCASLANVFEDRPELDDDRDILHAQIALTPSLDWLLLTKRPEVAIRYYADPTLYGRVLRKADLFRQRFAKHRILGARLTGIGVSDPSAPIANLNRWIGVSIEDQARCDERLPLLRQIPAAIRFVSYEPALEAVDFWRDPDAAAPDWIIVGAESGAHARDFAYEWARRVIVGSQRTTETAVFVKQVGRCPIRSVWPNGVREVDHMEDPKGGDPSEWPESLRIRDIPQPPW